MSEQKGRYDAARKTNYQRNYKMPVLNNQQAEVLNIIRLNRQVLGIDLMVGNGITAAWARIHELRALGFNIITTIVPEITFRGKTRRRVARYSLGSPEWTKPGKGGRDE